MITVEKATAIPEELLAELEEAIRDAMNGIWRPEKMDEAARALDEGREEIRRRIGETHIAAELTERDE